ncbi:MAG: hypothetical protein O3B21_09885 [Proteobacteria bacterium]|nr:hypothetical protein [Pseudomonadota bacterium]MDA1356894.1 hypothetical protein [Pseudomonadota bacterium]
MKTAKWLSISFSAALALALLAAMILSDPDRSTNRSATIAPPARAQSVNLRSLLDQGLISATEAEVKRRNILATL